MFFQTFTDGPNSVRLSADREVYQIGEGRGLPGISCNAECEPHCSFKWYREIGVEPVSVGSDLVMSAVSRQDTGRYYCMAKNVETGQTVKSPYRKVYVHCRYTFSLCYNNRMADMYFTHYNC